MLVVGEQPDQAFALPVGGEPGRAVAGETAVAVSFLLHAAAAPVEGVAAESDDVEAGPSPRPPSGDLRRRRS